MKKKLFAFWKYDQFPYCLGGEITDMRDNGSIETVEYGRGAYFKPVLILPLEQGKATMKELKVLEAARAEAIKAVNKTFQEQALKIIKIPS